MSRPSGHDFRHRCGYNCRIMMRINLRILAMVLMVLVWASLTTGTVPALAQETTASAGGKEAVGAAGSESAESTVSEEIRQGVVRGAYWWSDLDPGAIAGFVGFGIDTVAFRFGQARMERTAGIVWKSGGDFAKLKDLPSGVDFRPVIETDASAWSGSRGALADWIEGEVMSGFDSAGIEINALEIRLPDRDAPDVRVLADFLGQLKAGRQAEAGEERQVLIGVNPSFFARMSSAEIEEIKPVLDGIVVYFMDYDYTSASPRITDRAWIDSTIAGLQEMGIPFIVVLPIYNRALVYREGESEVSAILPAIDLEALGKASDVKQMGTAGSEFRIVRAIDIPGAAISVGDRVRVLESLKEVDLKDLTVALPEMAPLCREIDLFRFPLVPGFDPEASRAISAAGWIASPSEQAPGGGVPEAEKKQLDQQHNQFQQIIMVVTLAMMMFVLMRMFSKGAGKPAEGAGGKGGGKGGGK